MDSLIRVTVAGCGTVGSGVVGMLTTRSLKPMTRRDVVLKYIVDIRNVEAPESVEVTSDFDKAINDTDILCETIGGVSVAYRFTKAALERGVSVVTSNKELVATHGDELKKIAAENGAWYLYEAAVCGGMPVLRPIKTCLAGNRITRIDGIVNGSTNYLISRMAKDLVSFPAALGEAKKLGFVEADPDDDLLGFDARRKLAILASSAFNSKLSDDKLIPAAGITRLTMEDIIDFHQIGLTVKLIAHAEIVNGGWTGWVRPALVNGANRLHDVDGVFNALIIKGDYVDEVMFYGRGAGMKPTASAIIGDIIEIARAIDRPFDMDESLRERPAFVSPNDFPAKIGVRVEKGCAIKDMPVEKTVELGDSKLILSCQAKLGELIDNPALDAPGVGIPLILL